METLFNIDWRSMFVPTESVLEIVLRGTIMFLGMFALLRVFRRQAGAIGMADLLVIVIIADAAQNGMSGDAKSITEAIILVTTIVLWDWLFDWLGFKSKFVAAVLEPEPVVLIRNGRMNRRNMDKELINEEELMGQLRQQGIENVADVKLCTLESNGKFGVVKFDKEMIKGNKNDSGAVN